MLYHKTRPLINLLRGWPHPSLLPASSLKDAASRVLSNPEVSTPGLLYGPDWGYEGLQQALAEWLSNFYKTQKLIEPKRITITGGASQSLACILQVFTDPVFTRNVWLVSPTYMLVFRIFDDSGFTGKLRPVPEDEEGIDIEFLKRGLEKSEREAARDGNNEPKFKKPRAWSKIYRHIIYAVPTFSNPSSKTMSLTRREELVRLAREYDALIITDDVYDFLQWPSSPMSKISSLERAVLPRVVDVDRFLDGGSERKGSDGFGNAVSNGSFSKICGPGLRTGWVEGTEKLAWGVSQTGSTRSGGAPSQLTSTYVSDLLKSGELQSHIFKTLQPTYALRYRKMIDAIEMHLIPLGAELAQSGRDIVGGYFIWLSLPPPVKGDVVAQRAKEEENLVVTQGELFQVPDQSEVTFPHDIRLCFSWEDEEKLAEGIERLARVISRLQRQSDQQDADGKMMQHKTGEEAQSGRSKKDTAGKFW
ncbi:PLP-dependent transferase [Patellaria atrata CBS 101060]|uniref:PLP-dependent transferase n=1 Tax=Patellaria atrata CBS 101060 TaxID=1346257 RepID=A0A9P4SL12_9PEZI|nr:PLP-dependent transferase [Patellaria atrata CBS 101060]